MRIKNRIKINSRSLPASSQGFTLLELLVVIAIIGLFSSIVFATVSNIRRDGRNTFRNKSVEEYVKAFSLYYDTYGEYPNPGDVEMYCLAKTPLECAFYSTPRLSNTTINNALSEYIEVQEPFPVIRAEPYEVQGLIYQCGMSPYSKCTEGTLTWFLEGNIPCLNDVPGGYIPGWDITMCQLHI